jgi:glyoxylase I family protein
MAERLISVLCIPAGMSLGRRIGMSFQRRQLLQILSYAFGSSFILPRNELAMAAQNPAQKASPAPPAKAAAKHESGGTEMEKVAGIGGLFFRAHDPKALGNWYLEHLGISLTPTGEGAPVWQPEAGPTVFSPFPETSGYFGDPHKLWMVNFRVHDLDKMVVQLRSAGIDLRLTRNLIPTSGASLVCMTLREIPSNCGNLHNSALHIRCFPRQDSRRMTSPAQVDDQTSL